MCTTPCARTRPYGLSQSLAFCCCVCFFVYVFIHFHFTPIPQQEFIADHSLQRRARRPVRSCTAAASRAAGRRMDRVCVVSCVHVRVMQMCVCLCVSVCRVGTLGTATGRAFPPF